MRRVVVFGYSGEKQAAVPACCSSAPLTSVERTQAAPSSIPCGDKQYCRFYVLSVAGAKDDTGDEIRFIKYKGTPTVDGYGLATDNTDTYVCKPPADDPAYPTTSNSFQYKYTCFVLSPSDNHFVRNRRLYHCVPGRFVLARQHRGWLPHCSNGWQQNPAPARILRRNGIENAVAIQAACRSVRLCLSLRPPRKSYHSREHFLSPFHMVLFF
jgi:hypothetical protein